jgi:hypothetical protein
MWHMDLLWAHVVILYNVLGMLLPFVVNVHFCVYSRHAVCMNVAQHSDFATVSRHMACVQCNLWQW